jgi:hypothetical protein
MRPTVPDVAEKGRRRGGMFATRHGDRCGAFTLKATTGAYLRVIVSDGSDWQEAGLPGPAFEHVSVSLPDRCPTWEEMCWVKGLFWGPEELVVQYHPPESEYVNNVRFCLHLWKPVGVDVPSPPAVCVGVKGVTLS